MNSVSDKRVFVCSMPNNVAGLWSPSCMTNAGRLGTSAGNKLLEAFSTVVRRRLDVRAQRVSARQVLFDAYEDSSDVYFPHPGTVISLIRGTDEGPQVEVALVGSEGFASMNSVLIPGSNGTIAVAQMSGVVSRCGARRLRA